MLPLSCFTVVMSFFFLRQKAHNALPNLCFLFFPPPPVMLKDVVPLQPPLSANLGSNVGACA